jgi:glucans biosynthesis protein C
MEATSRVTSPLPAAAAAQPKAIGRMLFIDNIRVFLTILVLLHHLMITYSGTGSWYYNEGQPDMVSKSLGGWFCAINQSYFMGLFLLISAYFVPGSYDRKGAARFLKDRLIRLGIPLLVYDWIINPFVAYAFLWQDKSVPFWRFFPGKYFSGGELIGQGPLWFVEVLLIFSLVYILWRVATRSRPAAPVVEAPFPSNRSIALFALLLGLVTFLLRIVFAMDQYTFKLLNLQLPFFAQYIALFIVGLIAYRRNWLTRLPDAAGRLWLRLAPLIILSWAPMMIINGAINDETLFKGGLNWQSLLYTQWESFICVSMSIAVVYAFRRFVNQRGRIAGWLVPNAYTAYIIHAPIIATLAWAAQSVALYPLLKWALVALVAIPLCFALSALIRKLPYTERVL